MKTSVNKIERKALELFNSVCGPGLAGAEAEFHCQNPDAIDGWLRLARKWLRMEKELSQWRSLLRYRKERKALR
jgi:hypothetical protein